MTKLLPFTFHIQDRYGRLLVSEQHEVIVGEWGALDCQAVCDVAMARLQRSLMAERVQVLYKGEVYYVVDRSGAVERI